jgi:hypothetical protein
MTKLQVLKIIDLDTILYKGTNSMPKKNKDHSTESTISEHMICLNSTQILQNEGRIVGLE